MTNKDDDDDDDDRLAFGKVRGKSVAVPFSAQDVYIIHTYKHTLYT